MMLKILAIAFLFIAPAVWAGDTINPDNVKWDTKEVIEAQLKEKAEKSKTTQEEFKIKYEKWQHDLESGPVGRFQAVSMGESGVIILDTKEGLVWATGAAPGKGPKIVYIGQVNRYSIPAK
jgi:hypothetical protein